MSEKKIISSYFYSWKFVEDNMLENVMAEFAWHGVKNLVYSNIWLERFYSEPRFLSILTRAAKKQKINLVSAHAPWGQPYDICCPDAGRRPRLIDDHIYTMNVCAESGCKTYTIHVGAYESVFYHTPNSVLRPYGIETLEKLLPVAEKLGLIIAVENSYERSNAAEEVAYYIEHFNSPYIRCCLDVGHANMMESIERDTGKPKSRARYFAEMDDAWGDNIEYYDNSFKRLAPYIVTCHLHDNNGYSDAHAMPGTGTIQWDELIPALKSLPSLISMQSEISTVGVSVGKLVADCRKYMQFD